jgi:CubicO group peptidase (beta-lactamase class C family)
MLALLLAATGALVHGDAWDSVREGLHAWGQLSFGAAFAVHVGTSNGTLFKWDSPGFSSAKTRMAGASLSKWPAAVMISGVVNDGFLGYDDLASKHLSWWSTDPNDPRSRVTLRHLLSFRSGYTYDGMVPPWAHCKGFMNCTETLYDHSKITAEPGTVWAYLTCHLQFAGAMAVAASGLGIQEL